MQAMKKTKCARYEEDEVRDMTLTPQLPLLRQGDSPFQTLAACMDLAAALKSPDPEAYCSKLPVHQVPACLRCRLLGCPTPYTLPLLRPRLQLAMAAHGGCGA